MVKAAKAWVLHALLAKVPASEVAHAQPHVGQPVVLNLDLKDFAGMIGHVNAANPRQAWRPRDALRALKD